MQGIGCDWWVHKRCSCVKGSLSTSGDAFVCAVCEKAGDGEDINTQVSMDLGNGVCQDRVGKFCYLGDMLIGAIQDLDKDQVMYY